MNKEIQYLKNQGINFNNRLDDHNLSNHVVPLLSQTE